ncbi:MAG: hypothetical protein KA120_06625 [Candidatus Goldbacteria bacterium]|nr:hypothetical protein [Candidatus Goldiibacteriota bacterium]
MKKNIIIIISLLFLFLPSFASEIENLIVPQNDEIYEYFYTLSKNGYITSVSPEHFKYNPISTYEAAKYVCEAILAQKNDTPKKAKADTETLRKYYETYKQKVYEIYNKTKETRERLKEIEAILASPDFQEYKETVNSMYEELFDIEEEYKLTTFRGIPPFKVMGMLTARWQDVETFGVSHIHHTSLGGTFMQLWTEYIVSSDVSFKLNLTFERPANEAEKNVDRPDEGITIKLPEYWGTGQRFLDKYTINLDIFKWRLSTGFFWEDITPLVAKQILTERPVLFDRDVYALEETARGHYENVFLHSFQKRGDIWSKHPWYGIALYNMDLFGSRIKLMAGKAEKFDEYYDKLFLYEYAARWTYPFEIPGLFNNSDVSFNFFHTSNEKAEIQTLAPEPGSRTEFPQTIPDGYVQNAIVMGGDFKLKIIDTINLGGEFEYSEYHGKLPKNENAGFTRKGNAMYGLAGVNLPLINLEVKYTYIEPDYVATASAVLDTSQPTLTPAVEFERTTYAGDPTMLWNNVGRLSLAGNINIPNGFILLNYGTSRQIEETGKKLYLERFLLGNRLNGALYWHMFFSNYGFPEAGRDVGFIDYNTNGAGYHVMITDKWLTNKEMILSNYTGPEKTIKYFNNASVELRYQLSKLLGMENNFFIQGYAEIASLNNKADLMVDFASDMLLSQQILGAFAVYNLTRKMNVMISWGLERWLTALCEIPVDYTDTAYGAGFDYDFSPRTAIFLRAKRFFHEDKYIPANEFDGWQLYMELKNFF